MQPQQLEAPRAQTILVVDSDESTRRILDLSLRHAGFAVRVASNAEEGGKRLADRPDLVIVAADDAEGLDFCRRAKQVDAMAPAVVLMLDPNVENKRRGFEAGADDFVARPIYVQEVVARSRALLQKRDRERLEQSAQDNERFLSTIEDVPLVDLLRAIAANQKSGVVVVMGGEGARGELYFRQGRVVDAEVGRLSGRDAVYRLFCWSSGSLTVEWKSIRRKDTIEMPTHDLLMEALRRVDEWRRLLAGVPPLDTIFEVDYRLLAERLADIPDEVNRILRLFDGVRTFVQVIDDCGLPDLDARRRDRQAVSRTDRPRHPRSPSTTRRRWAPTWKDGCPTPPGRSVRSRGQERDLFGAGPDPAVGVHGRRTAPIDPLGDGAREALDDDMRVRFTDRLQADGSAGELAGDRRRAPRQAPRRAAAQRARRDGIPRAAARGADRLGAVRQRRAPEHAAGHGRRQGTCVARGERDGDRGGTDERGARRRPEDAAARRRRRARRLPCRPQRPLLHRRVERRYGWSSDAGPPRSVSGEILVQKAPPARHSQIDMPRVHVREDSAKAYVRKSTATPPGSARALDEPPPRRRRRGRGPLGGGPRRRGGEVGEAAARRARAEITVDDGRAEAFSKSRRGGRARRLVARTQGAGRRRGDRWWSSSARPSRIRNAHRPAVDEERDTRSRRPRARPRRRVPYRRMIAPIPSTPAVATGKPATVDPIGTSARKAATPIGAAHEDIEERTADPAHRPRTHERGTPAAVALPDGVRAEPNARRRGELHGRARREPRLRGGARAARAHAVQPQQEARGAVGGREAR